MNHQIRLLVSVRSSAEALEALRGGADLIDVKEPNAGPLGKADDGVITDVVSVIDGRRPVSMACGEWLDQSGTTEIPEAVRFVKWGLAGVAGRLEPEFLRILTLASQRAVLVCYADSERAKSPSLSEIQSFIEQFPIPLLLIDTFEKDGTTLTDWIPLPRLESFIKFLRSRGTQVALAGSLNVETFPSIIALRPDWIAVRGAACEGGRTGHVRAELVTRLVNTIREKSSS